MGFFQIIYELIAGTLSSLHLPVVLGIVVVLLLLRWRKANMLVWALAWAIGLYVGIRFGFKVPVPGSVVTLYMSIAIAAMLVYVSSDRKRWASFSGPIVRLATEPSLRIPLVVVVLALPSLAAANVWLRLNVPLEAPGFGRTVHPAPPESITVHDREVDLVAGDNPYRSLEETSVEEFQQHRENGRRVYFQNCFYCHGDGLGGNGMFAHGLNPIPSNFTDPGVLPMFQETFFFWRISKGGPGLPEEGGPWDTAMPAWEKFLSEEEIWDVILFLYSFTDYQPRARHDVAGEH